MSVFLEVGPFGLPLTVLLSLQHPAESWSSFQLSRSYLTFTVLVIDITLRPNRLGGNLSPSLLNCSKPILIVKKENQRVFTRKRNPKLYRGQPS